MKSILKYGSAVLIMFSLFYFNEKEVVEIDGFVQPNVFIDSISNKLEKTVTKDKNLNESKIKSYNFECKSEVKTNVIVSPKPEWDKRFDQFIIDNSKDTSLRNSTGSILQIPKDCFKSIDGEDVKGYLTIHYREFHNAMEVALSGIPMNIGDSAQLVSGGMFEIRAKKEGKDLLIKEDKTIIIDLMSSEKNMVYDHYYLDEETMAWENKGDLNFDTIDASREIAENIRWWEFTKSFEDQSGFFANNNSEVILAVRESERKKFDRWNRRRKGDSKGSFYTIFSKRRFPGQQAYKYLSWRIMDDNASSDVNQFMLLHNQGKGSSHSKWSDVTFSKCDDDAFYVHFSNQEKNLVLKVKPDSKSYPGENKFIKKQLRLENKLVLKSEQIVKGLFEEAVPVIKNEIVGMTNKDLKKFMLNHAIYKSEIENVILKNIYKLPNAKLPYRAKIQTTELGVHNIDAPIDLPSALIAGLGKAPKLGVQYFLNSLSKREKRKYERNLMKGYPIIDDEKRDFSSIAKIIIINEGVNTLNEFVGVELKKEFKFLKKEKCLGIVFMIDGSTRVILPKQFKKQKMNQPTFKFSTELCDSETELMDLLNVNNFSL